MSDDRRVCLPWGDVFSCPPPLTMSNNVNCRWQVFGVHVPSEVHRGVRGHKSQCGRAVGRLSDADPTEEGAQPDSGESGVGVIITD